MTGLSATPTIPAGKIASIKGLPLPRQALLLGRACAPRQAGEGGGAPAGRFGAAEPDGLRPSKPSAGRLALRAPAQAAGPCPYAGLCAPQGFGRPAAGRSPASRPAGAAARRRRARGARAGPLHKEKQPDSTLPSGLAISGLFLHPALPYGRQHQPADRHDDADDADDRGEDQREPEGGGHPAESPPTEGAVLHGGEDAAKAELRQ